MIKNKRKHFFSRFIIAIACACILFPAFLVTFWSFVGRWPWPGLLPQAYTLRTIRELLFGTSNLPQLLFSSIALASCVACLGTIIALMTARATEVYDLPTLIKRLIGGAAILPLLIPTTVFTMGIQVTLLRFGLADTIPGVVLVHLVVSLPYCVTIMTDITHAVGTALEEQAMILGATPLKAFYIVTLPRLLPGMLSSFSMGFILSYSQYFTTLMVGGGRIKTIALVLVPYIQSGDRALSSAYSVIFVGSALLVFHVLEHIIRFSEKGEVTGSA